MDVRDWVIRAVRSHSIAWILRLVQQQLYAYSIMLSLRRGGTIRGPMRSVARAGAASPNLSSGNSPPYVCALNGLFVSTGPVDVRLSSLQINVNVNVNSGRFTVNKSAHSGRAHAAFQSEGGFQSRGWRSGVGGSKMPARTT